jgi:hypothetical protein
MHHLITYLSSIFSLVDSNYKINDEELLGIVDSFKVWSRYLEEALDIDFVYTKQ